jgi:diguanylate cyclase (GGDEF)-like protein
MDIQERVVWIVGEDRENDISLQSILKDEYPIVTVMDSVEAIERIKEVQPDLILLNAVLHDMDRWDLLRKLNTTLESAHVSIIVNVDVSEVEIWKERGLEVSDFIMQPIRPEVVKVRVLNHLGLGQFRGSPSNTAATDLLSGVGNRQYLDDVLASEWRRAIRHQSPQSLILADIDFFSSFNEKYGRLAGNACLRKISAAIVKCAKREIDFTARYGGDEFACLLAETDITGAVQVASGIQDAVEELNIPHAGSLVADHITLSLGVATMTPSTRLSPERLISRAEMMLTEAKRNGHNQLQS